MKVIEPIKRRWTPREFQRAQWEYREASRPIIRRMVSLEMFKPIAYQLNVDGTLGERIDRTPAWIKEAEDHCRKMLDELRDSIFGKEPIELDHLQ